MNIYNIRDTIIYIRDYSYV